MGILLMILPALLCLEAMLSRTSVITPIDPLFRNIMWYGGLVLGIPLAAMMVLKPHKPIGPIRTLLILLFLPVFSAFAAESAAWRVADWVEFSNASERFAPATYPVKYASRGRKGAFDSLEIDPFDLKYATHIAVPRDQYDAVWINADDYCIAVMQRRSASGAIEILNDGVFTIREPAPAVLTHCREALGPKRRALSRTRE